MWKLCVCACLLASGFTSEVPKVHLSDVDYVKLPKLFALDHYDECLVEPGAAFCLASFELTSPKPSQLYDTMKEISQYERFNYNHTKIHRGVCVTKSCKQFLKSDSTELDVLLPALESCVNQSVNEEFGFEAKIDEVRYCKRSGETLPMGWTEYLFALVTVALLALNFAGTVYDIFIRKPDEPANPWLMAFSVRISWEQLTMIRKESEGDPRLHNLRPIQGLRVLTMFLVVMSHVVVIGMYRVPPDNPRFIEIAPYSVLSTILFNGHFVMQTFMVMASFLVAYNFLIFRETQRKFSWRFLGQAVVQRFFRLTPAYMYVISMTATWGARWVSGPLCFVMEDEREVCRNKWWLHLFYVHNIVNASDICLPQSWYLGADFQLFILGMAILMVIWRWPSIARRLLASLMLLATGIQFYMIYFHRLHPPILMQSPERVRNLFKNEPAFWTVHTTFQGNLQGYLLGLMLGITYYNWEKAGYKVYQEKWFRVLHKMSFPLGLLWVFMGHPFVMSDEENYLHLALYAMIDRLLFAIILSFLMIGCFYKIESVYYSILGWRGWQALGRLSYGVMLLHTSTFLNMSCTSQYPRAMGFYASTNDWFGNLVITYLLAVPLALLVEYPLQRVQKVLFQGSGARRKVEESNGKTE